MTIDEYEDRRDEQRDRDLEDAHRLAKSLLARPAEQRRTVAAGWLEHYRVNVVSQALKIAGES